MILGMWLETRTWRALFVYHDGKVFELYPVGILTWEVAYPNFMVE